MVYGGMANTNRNKATGGETPVSPNESHMPLPVHSQPSDAAEPTATPAENYARNLDTLSRERVVAPADPLINEAAKDARTQVDADEVYTAPVVRRGHEIDLPALDPAAPRHVTTDRRTGRQEPRPAQRIDPGQMGTQGTPTMGTGPNPVQRVVQETIDRMGPSTSDDAARATVIGVAQREAGQRRPRHRDD